MKIHSGAGVRERVCSPDHYGAVKTALIEACLCDTGVMRRTGGSTVEDGSACRIPDREDDERQENGEERRGQGVCGEGLGRQIGGLIASMVDVGIVVPLLAAERRLSR